MKTAPKNDDLTRFLPVGVRKCYFLLSKADREVLNIALGKYQPAKRTSGPRVFQLTRFERFLG
jgi:hypothetical protein